MCRCLECQVKRTELTRKPICPLSPSIIHDPHIASRGSGVTRHRFLPRLLLRLTPKRALQDGGGPHLRHALGGGLSWRAVWQIRLCPARSAEVAVGSRWWWRPGGGCGGAVADMAATSASGACCDTGRARQDLAA